MKLKSKNTKTTQHESRRVLNTAVPFGADQLELTHHQSVKQSLNYQTAECGYSIKVAVPNDSASVQRAIAACESLVESAMTLKFKEQWAALKRMGPQD